MKANRYIYPTSATHKITCDRTKGCLLSGVINFAEKTFQTRNLIEHPTIIREVLILNMYKENIEINFLRKLLIVGESQRCEYLKTFKFVNRKVFALLLIL